MRARTSSKLALACTALLVLALFGTTAAAVAKTASEHHPARISGSVTKVDTTADTLTIKPAKGAAVTVKINDQTQLILDGSPAKLADVPVGASARAVYDPTTKLAARVLVHSEHPHAVVEGKVTDVGASSITIAPEEGSPVTLSTDSSTKVALDGKPSQLSAIKVGDTARALYDSSTLVAAAIEAESPQHELAEVEGKVTAVDASSITIAPEEGSPVTLGTDSSTKVVLDGEPSTLSAIKVGDKARALYDGTTLVATAIQAQSPHHELAEIEGQVTAVGGSTISITPDHPQHATAVTLTTSAATQVFLDGKVSKLGSIAVGDRARALYDAATDAAIVIVAESKSGD
jgi:preprotein translocase subunit YajC